VESVSKNIQAIISAEYMRDIFDCTVTGDPGQMPELTFSCSEERLVALQERVLGKTVLFTDWKEWTNDQIVKAYRSQYHVEEAFNQMKDTTHLSFRPLRHFTDTKIRVHAFYCVLVYTLAALLNKELEHMGHSVSINRMLDYVFVYTSQHREYLCSATVASLCVILIAKLGLGIIHL